MGNMSRKKKRRTRSKITRQNKFTMVSITFVVCVLGAILLYSGNNLSERIAENDKRIEEINRQIEEENERTEEIYDLKEEMQTEEYIADVAKSKLGLVKEDEILFKPEK